VRAPGALTLFDVGPDKRSALVSTGAGWFGINARIGEARDERTVDYRGRSEVFGITADGTRVLLNEEREVGRGTVLKTTDGVETVPLDPGFAYGLTPDGAWALVVPREDTRRLKMVSTGAGGVHDVPLGEGLEPVRNQPARWSRDGRRMFVLLRSVEGAPGTARVHVREADGSWRAVGPAGAGAFVASPGGETIAMRNRAGVVTLYGVDGRAPVTLEGETGVPIHWSADGRELFISGPEFFPRRLYRRDIASGRIQPWRSLSPLDPAGVIVVGRVLVAADDRSYVYHYNRVLNDLFLVSGLR
jgi:hypothetical protein